MVRATNAVASIRRRGRLFKRAKGFWGDRKNHIRQTKTAIFRALSYNYKHRKEKKREFRSLWIQRLSAAAKINGLSYNKLICGLKRIGCLLDRKALSELAIHDPASFAAVAQQAKEGLAHAAPAAV